MRCGDNTVRFGMHGVILPVPLSSWHGAELSTGATVCLYNTDVYVYEPGFELGNEYHLPLPLSSLPTPISNMIP
jgi:hypothetical protein